MWGENFEVSISFPDFELESEGTSVSLTHQTVRKNISLKLKSKTEGKPKKKEKKKSEKKAINEGKFKHNIMVNLN